MFRVIRSATAQGEQRAGRLDCRLARLNRRAAVCGHREAIYRRRAGFFGRRAAVAAALALVLIVQSVPVNANGPPYFRADDPLWQDPDRTLSIPMPTPRPFSKMIDMWEKSFGRWPAGSLAAVNVNTLGEVPDSSWFANRMSREVMSVAELVRGPNRGDGPDMSKPWTVVDLKAEGVTPGFKIRDSRGDLYHIKLDPLYWPQLATSTEVVGTKFFHAFGYHVPENYLTHWPDEYIIDSESVLDMGYGFTEPLQAVHIKEVLDRVGRRQDGRIQVVASKNLPGDWLGPFNFIGTRSDDPNDIFQHQDRRELRGLYVFASWMNHNDSDAVNTLDMWHEAEDGTRYVMHYMIDFGTIMGSGAVGPHARRVGNEYYMDWGWMAKAGLTFGIWDRPWRHVNYEEYPAVGRFESDYFRPEMWRPDYPNPAFTKMTLQDALWATRTVMRFSDEAIRAMVATGGYEDPAAESHVAETLIARRDKIVDYYLSLINPLDGFELRAGVDGDKRLVFTNLGVEAGLASACAYGYAWHSFGNETGVVQAIGSPGTSSRANLALPRVADEYLMVKLSTSCPAQPAWASEVRVFVRNGADPEVVGVERDEPVSEAT